MAFCNTCQQQGTIKRYQRDISGETEESHLFMLMNDLPLHFFISWRFWHGTTQDGTWLVSSECWWLEHVRSVSHIKPHRVWSQREDLMQLSGCQRRLSGRWVNERFFFCVFFKLDLTDRKLQTWRKFKVLYWHTLVNQKIHRFKNMARRYVSVRMYLFISYET